MIIGSNGGEEAGHKVSLPANRILAGGSGSSVNLKRGSSSVVSVQLFTEQKIRARATVKLSARPGERMTPNDRAGNLSACHRRNRAWNGVTD